jgi:hypothetical protein
MIQTQTLNYSSLFTKGRTLTVQACSNLLVNKTNIMPLFARVLICERDGGNPEAYIDSDIWEWDSFKWKTMPGITDMFQPSIFRLNRNSTNSAIFGEAKVIEKKISFTFMEALESILGGVMAGEADERGVGITAYFRAQENGPLFRLSASRSLSNQLCIRVITALANFELRTGSGVLCFA